jgi:hypothetical protein
VVRLDADLAQQRKSPRALGGQHKALRRRQSSVAGR